MYKKRIDAVTAGLRKNEIDSLLVTKPENIFYLTSFVATEALLVVNHKKSFVVTDFIYAEAASKSLARRGIEVFIADGNRAPDEIIASVLGKSGIRSLGVESHYLNLQHFQRLKRTLKKIKLVPTGGIVESVRETKDADEIAALKKAVKVTGDALKSLNGILRPDLTEIQAAKYIKESFIRRGADAPSFEPIIASQPSASQPHYIPKHVKIGNNRLILIDIGCKLGGYNSDLTRMRSLGKISSKFAEIYAILLDAQDRAIQRIRPGVRICEIDLAARQLIENKGFGRFFGHNTGHGIGLEIHERPMISKSDSGLLKEGMVFTVEPGIYIPGCGGLRIEDVVRVTRKGHEVLTDDIDKSI